MLYEFRVDLRMDHWKSTKQARMNMNALLEWTSTASSFRIHGSVARSCTLFIGLDSALNL